MAKVEELTPDLLAPGSFLAGALKRRRSDFNQRFSQARHAKPSLDGATFKKVLLEVVSPVVEQLALRTPERVEDIVDVLYDIALELTGMALLGAGAAKTDLGTAWTSILPLAPHLMAQDTANFVAAVSNAVYNIARVSEANLPLWISDMSLLAPRCPDTQTFRQLGKVVAWRCGLAHFREGALDTCATLAWDLACPSLGLPRTPAIPLHEFCLLLKNDPWLHPRALAEGRATQHLRVVHRTGGFRGFGGPFLRPPELVPAGDSFFVTDGSGFWILSADIFGASLTRSESPDNLEIGKAVQATDEFHLHAGGIISSGTQSVTIPKPDYVKSFAATKKSLALTTAMSHRVLVIGRCTDA